MLVEQLDTSGLAYCDQPECGHPKCPNRATLMVIDTDDAEIRVIEVCEWHEQYGVSRLTLQVHEGGAHYAPEGFYPEGA